MQERQLALFTSAVGRYCSCVHIDKGIAALELLGLAFGSFALGSLTSSLWIWTGEMNVVALRKRVYRAVTQKDMVWFDTKMGIAISDTPSL